MGHYRFAHHCLHTGAVSFNGPHAQRDTARGDDAPARGRSRKG